jgi:hypothetical protein
MFIGVIGTSDKQGAFLKYEPFCYKQKKTYTNTFIVKYWQVCFYVVPTEIQVCPDAAQA